MAAIPYEHDIIFHGVELKQDMDKKDSGRHWFRYYWCRAFVFWVKQSYGKIMWNLKATRVRFSTCPSFLNLAHVFAAPLLKSLQHCIKIENNMKALTTHLAPSRHRDILRVSGVAGNVLLFLRGAIPGLFTCRIKSASIAGTAARWLILTTTATAVL